MTKTTQFLVISQPDSEWTIKNPYLYMEAGFHCVKQLESGLEIGVIKMLFTWDLCYNINPNSMTQVYEYRYAYETEGEAVEALVHWDGEGHPPGNWIKRKGGGPDFDNPNYKSNDN